MCLYFLKQPVNKIPYKESGELSDKKENHGPKRASAVEAKGDGDNVTYEWNPCGESEPYAIAVDFFFLPGESFRLDLEPFFNPLPTTKPADPIGEDAAEPIAEGADNKAADGVTDSCQYT